MKNLDAKREMQILGASRNIILWMLEGMVMWLFTPQGREFCRSHKHQILKCFRNQKEGLNKIPWVYIDAGDVETSRPVSLAVGDTRLHLKCDGPAQLYRIIGMHGAKVKIEASNYAVATATNIDSHFDVEADETSIISVEKQ